MSRRAIERLADDLNEVQLFIRLYRQKWEDQANSPAMRRRIEDLLDLAERRERALIEAINRLEDCEHLDAEYTGGPDGSQECPDCGRVW